MGSPVATAMTIQIILLNEDGAFIEYWLAWHSPQYLITRVTFIPSRILQVRKSLAAIALQVCSMGSIFCCAHIIPEIATSSKTGDGQNE